MKYKLLFFAILLSYCKTIQAQFQDGLDPTFGTKGIVTINETIINPVGFIDAVLQPDGKIVATSGQSVARFHSNGTLDNSFAVGGVFNEPLYYFNGSSYAKIDIAYEIGKRVLLQPDGKLICIGEMDEYKSSFPLLLMFRLLPNGTLDSSFGRNGTVCDTILGMDNFFRSGMLLADGKIIVTGDTSSNRHQMLVRYKSNGTIDSSFGNNGKAINNLAVVSSFQKDIELQPDGRIITLIKSFGVARYLPDGNLDTSFNHIGVNHLFFGFAAPFSTAMALRPDGKIWVAGNPLFSTPTPFILARFNANGSIDSSFGGTGYKVYATDTGDENKVRDMLLLPDGKVVLGGRVMNRATKQYNFGLLRIKPDGDIDSIFGKNGWLMTQMNLTAAEGSADLSKLLLQIDNKMLALGNSNFTASPSPFSTIVRYDSSTKTSIIGYNRPPHQDISLFPNPAKEVLNIQGIEAGSSIELYDIMGKLVLQQECDLTIIKLDVKNLTKGIYTLWIISKEGNKGSAKVLKE